MGVVGAFMGAGVEVVPAGSHEIYLQWQTEDRKNLTGVTFSVAGQTVKADDYGRATVIVDAGKSYTISCSHTGSYSGDGPQTIFAESARQSFVYFYGSTYRALDAYPVGSIYLSVSSTNPRTLLGGGTWTQIAKGRTLIGQGTSDRSFSAGSTGGESTHKLSTSEMPSHKHAVTPEGSVDLKLDEGQFRVEAHNGSWSIGGYYIQGTSGICDAGSDKAYRAGLSGSATYNSGGSVVIKPTGTATFKGAESQSAGSGEGGSHNNLPPYLVCYIWQRTA